MLSIVLFGAPGAGKGTQSKMLVEKYNLTYISTGDILRKEIAAGTEIGIQAKDIINQGGLVDDEIIVQIIEKTIENSTTGGILFDGFPRTVVQAYILEGLLHRMNRRLLCLLSLEAPREMLIERMIKRASIEGRDDDKKEVILNRFQEYDKKTIPVAEFYKEKGIYCPVDGVGSVEEVFARLETIIDKTLENAYRNIILYGAPGSGRGTQAKNLAKKYDLVYVSTGAMIRDEIEKGSEIGMESKIYIERGDNVPDLIAIKLIEQKISNNPNARGFLFKGFPSTYVQAYIMDGILEKIHTSVTCMIEMQSNTLQCIRRLTQRSKTEKRRVYDMDPEIIIHRLESYENSAANVRSYYQKKNKYYNVNSDAPVDVVFETLCKTVDEALKKA
ncbi:MAG: adenylate kinase [Bacteroidales bacterium]|jgi:adenylate kinase|nr:adenylate kinase [Bacteroidales bacterium]MDD4528598.1 adenylate kinase [Bacteroidales bacterium]